MFHERSTDDLPIVTSWKKAGYDLLYMTYFKCQLVKLLSSISLVQGFLLNVATWETFELLNPTGALNLHMEQFPLKEIQKLANS